MNYSQYIKEAEELTKKNSNRKFNYVRLLEDIQSKITSNNSYREFYGDTSVFKMSPSDIAKCVPAFQNLVDNFGNRLMPLEPHTFHITLTSFNNPYVLNSFDKEINLNAINKTKLEVYDLLKSKAFQKYKDKNIVMKSYAFDITNAVVMRFHPASEEDYRLLIELRELFDTTLNRNKVREINFFLPHVSLAYLNNKKDTLDSMEDIRKWCLTNNSTLGFEVELSINELTYQYHTDMGNFIDVYNINSIK